MHLGIAEWPAFCVLLIFICFVAKNDKLMKLFVSDVCHRDTDSKFNVTSG